MYIFKMMNVAASRTGQKHYQLIVPHPLLGFL
jgi:hypothetical protein